MLGTFLDFLSDDSGATAIEYGLIIAFVALALVVSLQSMGSDLIALFTRIDTTIANG